MVVLGLVDRVQSEEGEEQIGVDPLGDVVFACDLIGHRLAPLFGMDEEAFGVALDRGVEEGRGCHRMLFMEVASSFLPAGIFELIPGIGRPDS